MHTATVQRHAERPRDGGFLVRTSRAASFQHRQGFSIGNCALWCATLAVIIVLHGWNRRDSDHEPIYAARVLLDCAPACQGQGKPPVAGLDRPAYAMARRAAGATPPKG